MSAALRRRLAAARAPRKRRAAGNMALEQLGSVLKGKRPGLGARRPLRAEAGAPSLRLPRAFVCGRSAGLSAGDVEPTGPGGGPPSVKLSGSRQCGEGRSFLTGNDQVGARGPGQPAAASPSPSPRAHDGPAAGRPPRRAGSHLPRPGGCGTTAAGRGHRSAPRFPDLGPACRRVRARLGRGPGKCAGAEARRPLLLRTPGPGVL